MVGCQKINSFNLDSILNIYILNFNDLSYNPLMYVASENDPCDRQTDY